jgi:enoyl-CoA hydratase/carnithine racemase
MPGSRSPCSCAPSGTRGPTLATNSGRRVDADEALRLGLVQIVAPDIENELQRLLGDIGLGSPSSHRAHKLLLAGVAEEDAGDVEQAGYSSQRFADTASAAQTDLSDERFNRTGNIR